MTKSNAFFLSVGALIVTAASWELYSGFTRADVTLCVAVMFFIPRRWLRQAPRSELFVTIGFVFPLALLISACAFLGQTRFTDIIRHIVCHPAFVISFWLIMIWGLYRKWQRERIADA